MKRRKKIFVTNDDGINSRGIDALVECMKEYGDVTVIAPNKPQSGVGHAVTMREPISVEKSNIFDGTNSYSCSGTPADCVKFGLQHSCETKPDLLVSGINFGSNASVNMLYSGTVAAAVEGALSGIPSIAFSSTNFDEEADLSGAIDTVHKVMKLFETIKLPKSILLNVNIPALDKNEIKGIKFCRQSIARWKEEFIEESSNNGKTSYWLKGEFFCDDKTNDTDIWALENGFVSIVPVYLDLTAHNFLKELKTINKNEKI
ncbi:MAG: 5'/3'-nucleotidase SurE [Bacteroidota bacterium]|nr:5'/3'-nucleotidase SurE [Bacteroidota bacterium]